ncbi:unnamed protein product [Leuciscus chuanchicus]
MGGATLKTDKELMKEARGAFDFMSAEGLLAAKWFDNKCVSLLSSACGITPLSSVKRWRKEAKAKVAVPCPSLIPAYNQHMGGIDLSDMLVHMYKTLAKSRRWYLPLFGYILDLCISNAWLVYKRDCSLLKEAMLPLKKFRLAVAHTLAQVNKTASKCVLLSLLHSCVSPSDLHLQVYELCHSSLNRLDLYSPTYLHLHCRSLIWLFKINVHYPHPCVCHFCLVTATLTYHNGQKFSTIDKDQDTHEKNCAKLHLGGFWYKACYYIWGEVAKDNTIGNYWYTSNKNYDDGMKSISMKIKRVS